MHYKIHDVKCDVRLFLLTIEGKKDFELRFNDRNYQVDDIIFAREQIGTELTGRVYVARVLSIMKGGSYGIEEGWCILGTKILDVIK